MQLYENSRIEFVRRQTNEVDHELAKAATLSVAEPEKKSSGGTLKLTVEKLFKVLQNRPIIELFKFFGWTTTSLCGNLNQPKPKTDIKLYKISQNRPIIELFKFFGWTITPLCGNLDQLKHKTDTKLYKISQNRPIIVDLPMKSSATDNYVFIVR